MLSIVVERSLMRASLLIVHLDVPAIKGVLVDPNLLSQANNIISKLIFDYILRNNNTSSKVIDNGKYIYTIYLTLWKY